MSLDFVPNCLIHNILTLVRITDGLIYWRVGASLGHNKLALTWLSNLVSRTVLEIVAHENF